MDSQNKELLHENEQLQEQVDVLRERLQALPALASKEIFRLSQQVRNYYQRNQVGGIHCQLISPYYSSTQGLLNNDYSASENQFNSGV